MHALLAEKSASPVAALRSRIWHCGVLGVCVEILIRFMQMPHSFSFIRCSDQL